MLEPIFVYGASGHAKVVIDSVERAGMHEVAWVIDDAPGLMGSQVFGYKVEGGREAFLSIASARPVRKCVVAIGHNHTRARVSAWLSEQGIGRVVVIHPAASIGRGVSLGDGTVVMAGAVVNCDTCVGRDAIINTGATVDHDCILDDTVHIAPGSHLCGGVTVGGKTLVGAGATVTPGIRIGANVIIGAGSTVVDDVPDSVLVVGSPARIVKRNR